MVSVKVTTKGVEESRRLMSTLKHTIPEEYWSLYKKNVVNITPKKSAALRRSIAHSIVGNELTIWWRVPYAAAQNLGYHTDKTKHFVPAEGYGEGGRGYMAMPGRRHYYRNYTTTPGAGFMEKAADMTQREFVDRFYQDHPEYR